MKYRENPSEPWKEYYIKALDSMPVGTQVEYTGTDIPNGWEQVNDYSTDEIDTGKRWIDGKPIYRKVVETNFTSGGSTQKVYTLSELGLTNIESVIELNSFSQGNPIEQDYYSASNDLLRTLINAQGLVVSIGSTYPTRPVKVYTIIEYTKTTD